MRKKIIFISIFVLHFNYILYNSLGINDIYKNGIRILVIGLLIFTILFDKKFITLNRIDLAWLFLLIISLCSFNISTGIINFMYIILVLIMSKDISIDIFMKKSYIFMLISGIFIFMSLQLGLTDNISYVVGERVRMTFGFNNVNAFSSLVYSFAIIFFLSKNITIKHYMFVTGLIFIFYYYTDTRTTTGAFLIYLVCFIILKVIFKQKRGKKNKNLLKAVLTIAALLPVVLSFVSPIILDKFNILDDLTSKRLGRFANYINANNLINIVFGGTTLGDVDNAFLILLYNTGILFTLLVLYMIIIAIIRLIDMKESKYIAFIISFMYLNAFESLLVRPEILISICFWCVIYKTLYTTSFRLLVHGTYEYSDLKILKSLHGKPA